MEVRGQLFGHFVGSYPDHPGSGRYALSLPVFERTEITLDPEPHGGESLVIWRCVLPPAG